MGERSVESAGYCQGTYSPNSGGRVRLLQPRPRGSCSVYRATLCLYVHHKSTLGRTRVRSDPHIIGLLFWHSLNSLCSPSPSFRPTLLPPSLCAQTRTLGSSVPRRTGQQAIHWHFPARGRGELTCHAQCVISVNTVADSKRRRVGGSGPRTILGRVPAQDGEDQFYYTVTETPSEDSTDRPMCVSSFTFLFVINLIRANLHAATTGSSWCLTWDPWHGRRRLP